MGWIHLYPCFFKTTTTSSCKTQNAGVHTVKGHLHYPPFGSNNMPLGRRIKAREYFNYDNRFSILFKHHMVRGQMFRYDDLDRLTYVFTLSRKTSLGTM